MHRTPICGKCAVLILIIRNLHLDDGYDAECGSWRGDRGPVCSSDHFRGLPTAGGEGTEAGDRAGGVQQNLAANKTF